MIIIMIIMRDLAWVTGPDGQDPPPRAGEREGALQAPRKGTNGLSTNGVTAIFMFFDRGTFWVLPLTYFCLPKSARAYLFPQSVKINYSS